MVERLQYGRDQLTKFWQKEVEFVRKAMGFRKPAHVVFDQMSLSDEAAEKNLLIQLADRDIISHETILERFKEIPSVEKMRLQRESTARNREKLPDKASPFHNANHKKDLEKMDKQAEVNEEKESKKQQVNEKPPLKNDNGRPLFKQDEEPRKKRVETPKSTPGLADMIVWASSTFDSLSVLSKAYLGTKNKSNMRQLTKAEASELEDLKVDVLTKLEPLSDIDNESIFKALSQRSSSNSFKKSLKSNGISLDSMTMDNYKKAVVGSFVEFFYA